MLALCLGVATVEDIAHKLASVGFERGAACLLIRSATSEFSGFSYTQIWMKKPNPNQTGQILTLIKLNVLNKCYLKCFTGQSAFLETWSDIYV